MDKHERRAEVERLMAAGFAVDEIASEVDVPVRTVYRDMQAIRKANLLARQPEAAEEMVKGLCRRAQRASDRLRRIANTEGCPYRVRVRAELKAWEVYMDHVKLLQAMGYLPDVTRK